MDSVLQGNGSVIDLAPELIFSHPRVDSCGRARLHAWVKWSHTVANTGVLVLVQVRSVRPTATILVLGRREQEYEIFVLER